MMANVVRVTFGRILAMEGLRDLSFGAPAAERDIGQGLEEYFVATEAFNRVYLGSKAVVIGNRGTGKSAIFKILAQREKARQSRIVELAPEDYSYEMLSSTLAAESSGSWAKLGAYAVAWKHLILVEVMKQLAKAGRAPGARITNYLRDNHRGIQQSPISALISYLKRMEGIKVGPYEASVKVRELDSLYKLDALRPLIPSIQEACGRQRVIVLVDELDRGWDASEDAKAFVAGLFQACISINDYTPNLRVCISLRQELYDGIPALYEDAQKYRDLIEVISWDESTLLKLAAGRIRYSLQSSTMDVMDDEKCWNRVFAETLEYRKSKSFNYMIDRTLYRPRELIHLCTTVLETAYEHGQSMPFDYQAVSEAETVYSEERAKDIAAEYRHQYPGLLSVFETFRGAVHTLDREELETHCLELSVGDRRVGGSAEWIRDQDPESIVEVLWRIGFLRAQAVGGVKARRRSGSSYLGPHQVANLNLQNLNRFQVHPMFRAYLGTRELKGRPGDE